MNRLGQKHANLNLNSVKGLVLTKAQKKSQLKKKAREVARERKNEKA
jgi:hypothetical protein